MYFINLVFQTFFYNIIQTNIKKILVKAFNKKRKFFIEKNIENILFEDHILSKIIFFKNNAYTVKIINENLLKKMVNKLRRLA